MGRPRVEIGVLGTTTLVVDGVPANLSAHRMRSLLAALVLGPGQSVSSDRLVDALWERRPSAVATNTLQGYISRMRRLIEPQNGEAGGGHQPIQHTAGAYTLNLSQDALVDADHFDASITAAQGFLRGLPDSTRPEVVERGERVEVQRERLDRALSTWRGDPYADLNDDSIAVAERRRLAERRVDGQTALLVMDLMLGRAVEAAVGLQELVDAHPLREQLWRLWAVALLRSDRQAHALDALARLRRLLSSELGIDPSPAVSALHEDILRQHPSVLGTPTRSASRPELVTGPDARTTTHQPPLLGREREARLLKDAVRATVNGHGRHAVVVAAPGMGKSRLIAEVIDAIPAAPAITTVALRGAGPLPAPPLWSLARAVADLSARTGIEAPAVLRAPTTEDPFEQAAAFADYVRTLAVTAPVVLVVDDLHRIDGATVGALAHLVGDVPGLPVMVLVSRRPGVHEDESDALAVAIARSNGLWLELTGLDIDDTRRLADGLASGRIVTDSDAERLTERSGGNPLHLAALLERTTDEVPPQIVALVRSELQDLPEDTVGVLRAAAVVGPRFSAAATAPMPDQDWPSERVLDKARRSGLVRRAADEWEFSSPVIHEAVLTVLARREHVPPRPQVVATSTGLPSSSPRRSRLALVSET